VAAEGEERRGAGPGSWERGRAMATRLCEGMAARGKATTAARGAAAAARRVAAVALEITVRRRLGQGAAVD
jgi:hypothetical protein